MRKPWIDNLLVLLASVLLSAATCRKAGDDHRAATPFAEPPEISSKDGVLATTLEAAPTSTEVGGTPVTTLLYNGLFIPPTLRLRPGDQLLLDLQNRTGQTTNMHYHGTNVSPRSPSDNVFLHIGSGHDFHYEVNFPEQHPQGLFYYHPHFHGLTEFQIGSGMSGLLSVEGLLDPFPELHGIVHRFMVLRDIQIVDGKVPDPPDSSQPTLRTLNGLVNPTSPIRSGETQLWRVANIGADIYYDLELDGHKLYEIARDGYRHNQLVELDHIFLPVSARTEFLVVGGPPGEYAFKTRHIFMGPQGDTYPEVRLATLVSQGEGHRVPLPTNFPEVPDLRDLPVCCRRTFDFSENSAGTELCINNVQFGMNQVNTIVRQGCVEEWTVNNCTGENHVFHHHQLQFQVIKVNGQEVPFVGRQDTVNLDYRVQDAQHPDRCTCDSQGNCTNCTCPTQTDPYGSVVVRIPYTNPVIAGKAVYHCHIGAHEDSGMMQTILISPDAGQCEAGTPSSTNRGDLSPSARAICNFQ